MLRAPPSSHPLSTLFPNRPMPRPDRPLPDPAVRTVRPRTIAIAGRPNVGKSAIFNRIANKRIAIVHSAVGVTRDRLVRDVEWEGVPFTLIDTGGINRARGENVDGTFDAGICEQAEAALLDAAAVIFVVDILEGPTPQDAEVSRLLHRTGLPVFVAANKADTADKEAGAAEFERFGFPVFPVSALHHRGFFELMDAALAALPPEKEAEESESPGHAGRPLRIAIVGRPNAGKSSYVNRLLHENRVLVSDVPGTTRDSIDVSFAIGEGERRREYVLVDTAGVRRQAKEDTAVEYYSRIRMQESVERADVVMLMIDATRGVGLLDKRLAGLVDENGKGCLVAVNKWDLTKMTQEEFGEALAKSLPFLSHCPVVYLSAKTGDNVRRCLAVADHVAGQMTRQLGTGALNRAIEAALQAVSPPSKNGKPLRIYYGTQVCANPVTIRLFVNEVARFPRNYRDYLIHSLRRTFGLEGAPVHLQLRERERSASKNDRPTPPPPRERRPSPKPASKPRNRKS